MLVLLPVSSANALTSRVDELRLAVGVGVDLSLRQHAPRPRASTIARPTPEAVFGGGFAARRASTARGPTPLGRWVEGHRPVGPARQAGLAPRLLECHQSPPRARRGPAGA